MVQDGFGHDGYFVIPIGTKTKLTHTCSLNILLHYFDDEGILLLRNYHE